MSDEKIYVGNGKTIPTNFGEILKFSFSPDDLEKLNNQAKESGNGWVNIAIFKRKEVSEKGTTHYATIDTWKPENREGGEAAAAPKAKEGEEEIKAEDLPF